MQQQSNQRLSVNLQIVGVQKAGTSALAHFLSQHPDICLVDGKEAHVFDQPDFFGSSDQEAYAEKRYSKKLSSYRGESVICDATPVTLFNPHYLKACVEYNPNAKFIVLLRDPVERAQSHYRMMKKLKRENKNMLIAFVLESWRLRNNEGFNWSRQSPWRNWSYLHRGLYKNQLKLLYSLIKPEQVLVLNQKKLQNQHEATLNEVFAFIGLAPIKVKQERIFVSEAEPLSLTDSLARAYARLFFAYHRLFR